MAKRIKITLEWRKNPSVTTGGKDYFYTSGGENGSTILHIVWDRREQRYACQIDHVTKHYVDTVREGQEWFESIANSYVTGYIPEGNAVKPEKKKSSRR